MNHELKNIENVTQELLAREPLFHRPEFGTSRKDFERMIADDFWEVGASGKKYSREYVLDVLEDRHRLEVREHWVVTDFSCRWICPDTYLVTYQLEQEAGRLSRRAALWQLTPDGWKALYHQGTLIT